MASVSKRQWTHKGVTKEAWTVRYFDDQGVRRSKQFDQKKPADAFKKKMEREIDDGIHVAANASRTVADAMKEHLEMFAGRLADGSIGESHYLNAEGASRIYIIPKLGNILLRDLTPEHVLKFSRDIRATGQKAASVRKYLAHLRIMEKMARKRGWLKTQPVADAISELPRSPMTRIETFDPDEMKTILRRSGECRPYHRPRAAAALQLAVHLSALCGLRLGEVIGLPVGAIDLENRRLTVRQAADRQYKIKTPKTPAGHRTVPIPSPVVVLIREWLEAHYVETPDRLLLATVNGVIWRRANVGTQWIALLTHCGIPARHFHALRHFFTSWHIMNGTPAPDVAKLAGHSHFDMTLRTYTHALLKDDAAASQADRIAGLLTLPDARVTQNLISA